MTKTLKKRGGLFGLWNNKKTDAQIAAEKTHEELLKLRGEQDEKDKQIQEQLNAEMEEAKYYEKLREFKEATYGGKKSRKQKKTAKRRKTRRVKKSNK